MESRIGLDYIVDNREYVAKLAGALDTNNVTVKKQVLELLSALCVYNQEGYARAIDALEHYKELKGERYRLNVIVRELREAQESDYQAALVAFINCLIISTQPVKDRIRIRNEFIGLKLLPVLNALRQGPQNPAPDLQVQLDVFDEQRESDEAQLLHGPYDLDLNSHLDVFYAILRQVSDTPQEIPFLSILQHLLRIDGKEAVSDIIWDTAETLVHRATLLENRQDATRLLRSPSQSKLCCHCACHSTGHRDSAGSRKQSLATQGATSPTPPPPPPPPLPPPAAGIGPPPPPPPPPPLLGDSSIRPPPPPPPSLGAGIGPTAAAFAASGGGGGAINGSGPGSRTPAPPPNTGNGIAPDPNGLDPAGGKLLPQQDTPTPRAKMKTINWNKIPNHKVVGKHNIWSLVARTHQGASTTDLDWDEMEGLFCQQAPSLAPGGPSGPNTSPRLGGRGPAPIGPGGSDTLERKRKEPAEISLLDGKRSLNVNIFLKQFRSSNEDIIELIREGAHEDIGAEKLRGLLKLLPELDELELLRGWEGDKSKLGTAERFLLQLVGVPNYKLRIESMLLQEEFAANMGYLEPSISSMILAGEDLMTNKQLQEVLYMVLVAGNFLNAGGYAGNAAGVKLSSLQKLTDIRANKPGMNLIHYVALQAEKKRKELLRFTDDLTALEEATKTTVEQLQNEINALDTRIKKIRKQIELPTTERDIQDQMAEFLQMAGREVAALQRDMAELEAVRVALADFFCEDVGSFKLEECFRVFHGFCAKFRQAVAENERRRVQEEQANARRRQREEQLAARRRQFCGPLGGPPGSESEGCIVDSLLNDIRTGLAQKRPAEKDFKSRGKLTNGGGGMTSEEEISVASSPLVTRRRMGSFSGPSADPAGLGGAPGAGDTYSPEVLLSRLLRPGFSRGAKSLYLRDARLKYITPNGSLRRRRSRVPSEEDESNLMDFLRASGHDGTRERKSWGSLDRSWARRARGGTGRKRPDLLGADFSADRERANSPSPLAESKPILPAGSETPAGPEPDPTEKPKAWRQKIEAWLQENEKEERQTEELRRRSRRVQVNRRSLEADSESEGRSTLDTLPEEEKATGTPSSAAPSTSAPYQRVYQDWRPTVEKTDVVRAMEAIEEAQSPGTRDKSAWRKSNLNVPNSTEETEQEARRLRRQRSRGSTEMTQSATILQAIKEEDKRKGMIGALGANLPEISKDDRLIVYIRNPDEESPKTSKVTSPPKDTTDNGEGNLPPTIPRRLRRREEAPNDRVEIDSDNIETPPATRRVLSVRSSTKDSDEPSSPTTPTMPTSSPLRRTASAREPCRRFEAAQAAHDEEMMGDGQFDRFSATRRTRRYKKEEVTPTSANSSPSTTRVMSPELVSEKQVLRPATLQVQSYPVTTPPTKAPASVAPLSPLSPVDKENRLKKWQERLRRGKSMEGSVDEALADIATAGRELQSLARRERVRSLIEPRQVEEAKTANRTNQYFSSKTRPEHEHDEGFEETQSLVSETPSQGGTSSEAERRRPIRVNRADSSGSGDTSSSTAPPAPVGITSRHSAPATPSAMKPGLRTSQSVIPRRSEGSGLAGKVSILRRPGSIISGGKRTTSGSSGGSAGVERSNSRASLRSSRSSLNSSASVNTVRNVKPLTHKVSPVGTESRKLPSRRLSLTSNSSSPVKRPLAPVQPKSTTRVPASRSSSSGSSIGPTVRRPKVTHGLSASFKENAATMTSNRLSGGTTSSGISASAPSVPASRSSSSGSSIGPSPRVRPAGSSPSVTRLPSRGSGGFMRPTASSQAKDTSEMAASIKLRAALKTIK